MYLVPLIFESYASNLISRLDAGSLARVLEIAAGTGVVTRALAATLPESVSIVATDLNEAMLEHAISIETSGWWNGDRRTSWFSLPRCEL